MQETKLFRHKQMQQAVEGKRFTKKPSMHREGEWNAIGSGTCPPPSGYWHVTSWRVRREVSISGGVKLAGTVEGVNLRGCQVLEYGGEGVNFPRGRKEERPRHHVHMEEDRMESRGTAMLAT